MPNTISGDGEELDAYVLGINTPLSEFEGKCIAVIHRTNDNDDKLIIVPDGSCLSDIEIEQQTAFQENGSATPFSVFIRPYISYAAFWGLAKRPSPKNLNKACPPSALPMMK